MAPTTTTIGCDEKRALASLHHTMPDRSILTIIVVIAFEPVLAPVESSRRLNVVDEYHGDAKQLHLEDKP